MFSKIFTTVKYSLIFFNFLFLLTGIIVLSVGSSVQSAYNGYHPFLSERFFSLPAFCIASGVIIFIIAFFGFYGAFMENYYMNMAFVGAMVLMFIFQLSACIAGYALRGNTVALVQQQLTETMPAYGPPTSAVTMLWDEVQTDFECCGVTNASEWLTAFQNSTEGGIPVSCCPRQYGAINEVKCNATLAYAQGCSGAFGTWVQAHAASIGVAGVFLVLIQALVVGGALWMANMLRQERAFN